MELIFKFTKQELYLLCKALETNEEMLLRSGEDESCFNTGKLKRRLFEIYNLEEININEVE